MESQPLRMLSGIEIVNRGRNVTDCILPEVGQKEVTPNGSWLETKQVQTALEARKALVAVERIDKVGALSHADWNEQLKLAEVTQQVGGHWQYIGHTVNGTFFLLPEEALYLMETNCLLLKHNQVTVSLQKAYSLLLDEHMTLTQYKVYASLSRVGYKVFRHGTFKSAEIKKTSNLQEKNGSSKENASDMHFTDSENKSKISKCNGNSCKIVATLVDLVTDKINKSISDVVLSNDSSKENASDMHFTDPENKSKIVATLVDLVTDKINKSISDVVLSNDSNKKSESPKISSSPADSSNESQIAKDLNGNDSATQSENESMETQKKDILSIDKHGVIRPVNDEVTQPEVESSGLDAKQTDAGKNSEENKPKKPLNVYQIMKQKIKNRKIPPADPKTSQDNFKNIPDCFNKQVVTVKVPSEEYLPRNIYLNNTSYVLNLQEVRRSKRRSKSASTGSVENRAMYRTIRNSSESETAAVPTLETPQMLPNTPLFQQPYQFYPNWRSRFNQFPRYQFNQHPFFYRMMHFMPQSFTTNRPRMFTGFMDHRKRQYDVKEEHLSTIKSFANKLKQFRRPAYNTVRSLQGLVARFNEIYNAKIRITHDFDVMDDSDVETIELDDDDDDVEIKRPRLDNETYEKYLASVKALASKLKNLERKNKPISKQKKAFCNLLENFNKTFNTEFQLDSKWALVDKKLVILDSSSDSDVVATDDVPNRKKRSHSDNCEGQSKKRKVLNPLNFLRKVNEGASTSKSVENVSDDPVENNTNFLKYFNKEWLPNDEDFGKATPCLKTNAFNLWRDSQELFDFLSWGDLKTWVDLKITFCSHMEAVSEFDNDLSTHSRDLSADSSDLKPILQEPSNDWAISLEKLRIIKTNTEVQETCLTINFEVYNRDVQNFRKTDPPKPHFRVVCVDVHSKFPSGAEVRSLHSRYEDNITTVFAVVDLGSIVYLQINPKDLPVYVGND